MIWAWGRLQEHLIEIYPLCPPWSFAPTNSEEYYSNILSIFDTWTVEQLKLTEIQRLMRQAWNQRRYRTDLDKQKKKQSTYVLETHTKTKLEKLAKASSLNRHQMLEHLINQAYQQKGSDKQ